MMEKEEEKRKEKEAKNSEDIVMQTSPTLSDEVMESSHSLRLYRRIDSKTNYLL